MNNPKRGIPTALDGRLYRSLLEAKWASFFDLAGWRFEYEPFETDGWIPDFLIQEAAQVLVEVKPVSVNGPMPEGVAEKMERGAEAIEWEGELLILGVSPIEEGSANYIGWLRGSQGDAYWARAATGRWVGSESEEKNPDDRIGFCHETGSFCDRVTGCYDGGSFGAGGPDKGFIRNLWNRAASRVRWEP